MKRCPLLNPSRRPSRARLLSGSAICGAAALLVQPAMAGPTLPSGALPGAPTATTFGAQGPGGAGVGAAPGFTTVPNLLTVDVHSSRSIITWDSFNVGSGSTVAFSGMGTGDIAVNRATSKMVIEGSVTGGGALWFLSPGGVLVNGGTISAAGGVLMSNGSLNDSAFLGSSNLSGAMAAIQGSAALISLGDITPADTVEVTLGGDVVLSSSAALNVDVAKGGAVTLTAADGVQAGALSATAGDLTVEGRSIEVSTAAATGKLTLRGPLIVGAAGSTLSADGQVSLTSTIDGAGDLTIKTPGQTLIADDVGATTPLHDLTVGAGPLLFKGAAITANGDIALHSVSLGGTGAVAFSAGGAFASGDISGAKADVNDLTISAGSTLTLGGVGDSGRVKSANFAGGGLITLKGDISALDAVTFLTDAALVGAGARKITAGGASFQAVAMANGATLSVDVGSGAATFDGAVGTTGSTGTRLAVRAGAASFAEPNRVGVLAASVDNGGLDFTNSQALTIGAVDGLAGVRAKAGDVALQTSAGALTLASGLSTASTAQISLSAAGAITQTANGLQTGRLVADAGGAISLIFTNHISHLGAVNAPGQTITILDAAALTVDGPLTGTSIDLSGAGLTFTTLGAAKDLVLDATGGALNGGSASATTGHLKLSGATITLSGAATAGRDLFAKATNGDASLGSAAAGRDLSLTASGALNVTAASAGRDYVATAQDFGGGALSASVGHDLTIVDTGGGLTVGGVTAGRNLSITAQGGGALTVSGALAATGGDLTLATTGGGALLLGANVTTGAGHSTSLNASGAISQSGGGVSTGTLSAVATGGLTLARANTFSRLGATTNVGGGGVAVVDASPLTIDGPLNGGAGGVAVTGATLDFADLTASGSLTLTASSGALTGASATTTVGDLILSGRTVNISGPLVAVDGGVQVTATQGALSVGAVTAPRDILLRDTDLGTAATGDGGAITAGALTAGADVGVASADGPATLASVSAGDDVAIRALYGQVTVSGDVKSGRDIPGVTRTDDPGGAADEVVAGARFPDFDPASTTSFVLKGHDVDIQAQAIKVTGAIVAGVQQPGGDNPDAATLLDTTPSDVRLRSGRQPVPTAGLAASILVGDVTATRDIQIDSGRGVDAGALKAGQDVAVLARGTDTTAETDPLSHGLGATIGSATAGRHVVLYSVWGRTHVLGAVAAHHSYPQLNPDSTGDTSDGAGERLAAYIRYLDLDDASRPFISGPGDLLVMGRGVDLDGAVVAAGSIRIQSGSALTHGGGDTIHIGGSAIAATGDVRLEAFGADAAQAVTITTSGLAAGGDVAVWSRNGGATLGSLSASDDVVIRAAGSVAVSGTISAGSGLGTGASGGADQLVLASKGGALTLSGQGYDVVASVGGVDLIGHDINISGATTAGSNARLQAAGGVTTGAITATAGDVLVDAGGAVETGPLSAGRDIGVRSTGAASDVTVASAAAGDDVVLRGRNGILVNGGLSAGSGADSDAADQSGDLMAAADQITLQGHSYGLTGGEIDLKAGAVTVTGASTAKTDARFQASGAITNGDVTATEAEVLADAGGAIEMGRVSAGGDIGVRSTGAGVSLGQASAGDDLVLRAVGDIKADGMLTAAGGVDGDGAGDLLFNADRSQLAGDFALGGANIDAKTRGGSVSILGAAKAGADVRIQTVGAGQVQTAAITAGRDILLDGGGAQAVSAGDLSAGGDVALRGRSGAVGVGAVAADDDLVVRADGAFAATGALSAQGGADSAGVGDRLLSVEGAIAAAGRSFDLAANTLDIRAGGVSLGGDATAGADIHIQSTGDATLAGLSAGRDVLIDATGAVQAGAVSADRDVGIRSTGAGLTLDQASAGDDLVLRGVGEVRVTGALIARGTAAGDGAADALFAVDRTSLISDFDLAGADVDVRSAGGAITVGGAISAARDARLQTTGDGAVQTASVDAGRDVMLDGGSVAAGALTAASGDVAVRASAGGVALQSAFASDDLIVRAAQGVTVSGGLTSGVGADAAGVGDSLLAANGSIRWAADSAALDKVSSFDASGGGVDIRAGGAVSVGGGVQTNGSSVRFETPDALALASITAGKLIFVRAGQLTIGGDWQAPTVRIEGTSAAGIVLGDGVTAQAGAMVVTNGQFNRIDAATVQIFAGDSSGAARGAELTVGALAVDVARIRSRLELYAGADADVMMRGGFAPSSEIANATLLRIGAGDARLGNWTPRSIRIIADNGGAIGQSITTDGRVFTGVRAFGSVELNARDSILAGYQAFIDRLASAQPGEVAALVSTFSAPQGPNGPRMLLTAGSLSLRAARIGAQDTSSPGSATRTGIYINGPLFLGRVQPGANGAVAPDLVELSGAINNGSVVLVNGSAALTNLINLGDGGRPGPYYRLNSCVILQTGACNAQGGTPNVGLDPNRLTAVQLLDRQDGGAAEDPTVASATNEEIWRDPE
jgi:filamentous hemagglutinin family protein